MDHELLDQKGDFYADRDDTFSSLKHEFSRIFHENNLHSFTNASDIGFLDMGKLANQGFSVDYEGMGDMDAMLGRSYPKEDVGSFMGMHSSYSPMGRFLQQPNVGYGAGFANLAAAGAPQKQASVQDTAYYQSFQQPYKYGVGDYSNVDYAGHQGNNHYHQSIYDIYNQPDMLDTHPNNPLSLMWSNEANKATHKKSLTSDDMLQQAPQSGSNNRRFSSEFQVPVKSQTSFKVEQDFDKVSNKAIGMQLERVAKSMPDNGLNGPRRTNRISKPVFNPNMTNEDEDGSGSDDDKDEAFGDAKNRSSRGLRVLSLKVRDIVSKKKKTSYKEVAEALLQDINQKMKGKSQAEISKEEQNVKRRVYDALNVLIAADILRKEGKLVCCEVSATGMGSQNKKKSREDKGSLLEQIQELKRRRKEKVEALQELVFKSLAIRNLVRRNKLKAELEANEAKTSTKKAGLANSQHVNATRIDVVQENPTLKQKNQDVIHFPFIVLLSSSSENSMNLNMDTSQRQLSIESKKPFNIFGDIDVLLKMRLHYVPREIFEKDIPRELQKYVSHSFVDALK